MNIGLDARSYTVEVAKEGYMKQTAGEVEIHAANKTFKDIVLELQ